MRGGSRAFARRGGSGIGPRRQRREDRIEVAHGSVGAADHQAIAAVEAPDAAAGADIDIAQALRLQPRRLVDGVVIVGIAAVDDDVAGLQQRGDRLDDPSGDRGRQHQPDAARLGELADELLQRAGADRAVRHQRRNAGRVDVVDDAFVTVAHQAANHVRAHPAQSHHSDLHGAVPILLANRSVPKAMRLPAILRPSMMAKESAIRRLRQVYYLWFHRRMTGSVRSCS